MVKLTVEEHAEAHRLLWEEHGNKEDWMAWKGLSGQIGKDEIIRQKITLGNEKANLNGAYKKANKVRTEKYHANPEWAAEIRKKQSKPKSNTDNYHKPKSDEHKENMRKAALKRERFPCSKCGKTFTKANLAKHENSCNGKPYNDEGDIRTISASVDPRELVWHRDEEHRYITILEGQGWQLQYNGWLPILLEEGKTYHIQKMLMHRVIIGATDLKMRIVKDVEGKEIESPKGEKLPS